MIRLRVTGASAKSIGELMGAAESYVRACTNRIRDADIAESGEDRRAVEGAYW